MDMLRSCYPSSMILSQGQPPQAGQWYWCPEPIRYFSFPIAFGSRNWDLDKGAQYGLGEQGRPDGSWVDGSGASGCTGSPLGPAQWWQQGIPSAQYNHFCFRPSGGRTLRGTATFAQIFGTNPSSPYFTPLPGVTVYRVECWGCGANGSYGVHTPPTHTAGPGGGGGAYSASVLTLDPSTVYLTTTGTRGTGSGAAGRGSSFGFPTALVVALGGGPGITGGSTSGGVGQVQFTGGQGAQPVGSDGGGGGAGAGPAGAALYLATVTTVTGAPAGPLAGPGGSGLGPPANLGQRPGGGGGGAQSGSDVLNSFGLAVGGEVRVSWPASQ